MSDSAGYGARVRWDELFADLELEAAGELQRERDSEIAERTRIERSRIGLHDRLRASVRAELVVLVQSVGPVRGELLRVGVDWLLLADGRHEWVLDAASVLGVSGLPPSARAPGSGVAVRAALGWASIWRVLARDRSPLLVWRRDGSTMSAVADRVGEDFVEVSPVADGGPPDRHRTREAIPFGAVVAVRCPALG